MRIVEFSIENFKSIYSLPPTKLQKEVNIFIGKNNTGKSAIMDALFIALGNISNSTSISENFTEQLDKLWFFGDYSRPAIIKITVELDENQENELRNVSGLEEAKYADLEVALFHREDKVEWKLQTLNILGTLLKSTEEKLDRISKSVTGQGSQKYAPFKIVENANVLNEGAFSRFVEVSKDKIFRLIPYLGLEGEDGERIRGLNRPLVIPPSMTEYLEWVTKESPYRHEFIRLAKEINPDYASYLETGRLTKYYQHTSFKAEHFGSGEQLIDGLLAALLGISYRYGECIVILEEPENHLHPDYVRRLSYVIKKLAEERSMQILVVTHSPEFIKMVDWDSVFVLRLERVTEGPFEGKPTTTVKKLGKERKDAEKLAFELGISVGELPFIDVLILVEGETDKRMMKKSIQALRNEGYLRNLNFYTYKLYKIAELETKVKSPIRIAKEIYGSKVFVIADGDDQGREICKAAEECGLEHKNIFQWSEPDILCLCDKEVTINAIIETVRKYIEKYGTEIEENVKEELEKLLEKTKEASLGDIFKKGGLFGRIVNIIHDNVNEVKDYEKKRFYSKLKGEIGEIVAEKLKKVPSEIRVTLLKIDGILGGEYS